MNNKSTHGNMRRDTNRKQEFLFFQEKENKTNKEKKNEMEEKENTEEPAKALI